MVKNEVFDHCVKTKMCVNENQSILQHWLIVNWASIISIFARYSISRIIWIFGYSQFNRSNSSSSRDIVVSTMRKAMPLEENYSEQRERYRGDDGISVGRNSCPSRGISGLKKSGSQHTVRSATAEWSVHSVKSTEVVFQAVNGSSK